MYVCLWDFLLTTSIQTFALWLHPLRPKLAEYKVMKAHGYEHSNLFIPIYITEEIKTFKFLYISHRITIIY